MRLPNELVSWVSLIGIDPAAYDCILLINSDKLRVDLSIRMVQAEPKKAIFDIKVEIVFAFLTHGSTHEISGVKTIDSVDGRDHIRVRFTHGNCPFTINVETRQLLTTPFPK